MKAVILAGGLGSRISEETYLRPKPMVTIGDKPILWHIMKKFANHSITDFVICLGYKSEVIKEYFLNFKSYNSNVTTNTASGEVCVLNEILVDWNVTLVDTGVSSNTGERLKQVQEYVGKESFFFTYGDGLTDQDLLATASFHKEKGRSVTLTAVNPPARYGAVSVNSGIVTSFSEKTSSPDSLINGGYFLVNPNIFETLDRLSNPSWEVDVLPQLALDGNLAAFEHTGFWFAMDTLRDKEHLEALLESGSAPWLR
jgi:glucose-1-phosphate cytidylyltransferase